jgi:hypothetical protein
MSLSDKAINKNCIVLSLQEAHEYVDKRFFNGTSGNYADDIGNKNISLNIETAFDILYQIEEVERTVGIASLIYKLEACRYCMNYFENSITTLYSEYSSMEDDILEQIDELRQKVDIELNIGVKINGK